MKTDHLKTETVGNERVMTFTVPDPANTKRILAITINQNIDSGFVEMAIAADEQEQADLNHSNYIAVNLNDAG